MAIAACNGGGGAADAGGEPEVDRARAMTVEDAGLPPRAEALAVAESVEARANKEGAGARAVELHALAGAVFERVFRVYGKTQDAEEAIGAYDAASKDLKSPGACDAAMRGAALAGDSAHDAQAAFVAFYKLSKRGPPEPCAERAAAAMASLEAFRPPARVLDAIDRGLEAQGAVGRPDAGGGVFVDRVDHWPGKETARVVVALSGAAHYRVSDEAAAPGVFKSLDAAS